MIVSKVHFWFGHSTGSTSKTPLRSLLSFWEPAVNLEDISELVDVVGDLGKKKKKKKIRELIIKECFVKVWAACWSRNITTLFIALLLDRYFMKLHYCSNVFIFLSNILVYVHDKEIVFILILYCILLHWHVLLNISVYASGYISEGVYVLYRLFVPIIICKRAKVFC